MLYKPSILTIHGCRGDFPAEHHIMSSSKSFIFQRSSMNYISVYRLYQLTMIVFTVKIFPAWKIEFNYLFSDPNNGRYEFDVSGLNNYCMKSGRKMTFGHFPSTFHAIVIQSCEYHAHSTRSSFLIYLLRLNTTVNITTKPLPCIYSNMMIYILQDTLNRKRSNIKMQRKWQPVVLMASH